MPAFLDRIDLVNLRVANSRVLLEFARHGTRTHCDVLTVYGERLRVNVEV